MLLTQRSTRKQVRLTGKSVRLVQITHRSIAGSMINRFRNQTSSMKKLISFLIGLTIAGAPALAFAEDASAGFTVTAGANVGVSASGTPRMRELPGGGLRAGASTTIGARLEEK